MDLAVFCLINSIYRVTTSESNGSFLGSLVNRYELPPIFRLAMNCNSSQSAVLWLLFNIYMDSFLVSLNKSEAFACDVDYQH